MYNAQGESDYPFEVSIFTSVGFLLKENEDSFVITRDIIGNDVRGALVIPKENIIGKTFL